MVLVFMILFVLLCLTWLFGEIASICMENQSCNMQDALFFFLLLCSILPCRKEIIEPWFHILWVPHTECCGISQLLLGKKKNHKIVYKSGSVSFENHCIAFYGVYINFNEVDLLRDSNLCGNVAECDINK